MEPRPPSTEPESQRQARLFEALNAASVAMLRADGAEAMVGAACDALLQLGLHTTAYRLDGDTLVLTHDTIAPGLRQQVERLTGLDTANFSMPLQRVDLLAEVVQTGQPRYSPTVQVMRQALGSMAAWMAGSVVRMLKIGQLVALPILEDGAVRRVVVVLADLVQERDLAALQAFANQLSAALDNARLRTALVESEKLAALSRLAGSLAHNLNNRLTPMVLSLGLIEEQVDDPTLAGDLQMMRDALRRAQALSQRLAVFTPNRWSSRAEVSFGEVIEETRRLVEPSVWSQVVLQGAPTVPLLADVQELAMALSELVSNAAAACPLGAPITLGAEVDGTGVVLWCADDGRGMSAEVRAHAVEPFFSTDPSTGGMGLPVVHGIVTLHGGTMEIDSAPGQGCRVVLRLP